MTFHASRNSGTISTGGVSSVNITGTGTAFTAAQVGAKVYFNNGANNFTIATRTSNTSITATVAQTIPAGTPFTVDEPGTVGNGGISSANLTGVGTAFVTTNTQSRLDIAGVPTAFIKTVTNGTAIVLDRAVAIPDGSKYQIVSVLVQTGTDANPSQLLNIFGVTADQQGGNNGLFTPRITRIQVPYRIRQNGICTINATTFRLYMSLKNVTGTIESAIWLLNATATLTLGVKQTVNGVSTSASLPAIYFENDSTNWPTDAASFWAISGSQLNWYAAIESKAICYFEGKIDFGNATLTLGETTSFALNAAAVFNQNLTQSFTGNGLRFTGSAIQNKSLIPMSFGITNALARMFQVSNGRSDDINTDMCIDCDFGIYAGAKASVYGTSKGVGSVVKGWYRGTWDVPHTSSDTGAVSIYAKMQFAPKTTSGATITTGDMIYVFDEVDSGSRKDYTGAPTNSSSPGYVGTGNMINWLPTTQYSGAIGVAGLSPVVDVLLQVTTIPYNAVGSRDNRQSADGTMTYTIKSYHYQTTTFTTNTTGIGTLLDSPRLPADVYSSSLTLAQATARQSDIDVNKDTNTVTVLTLMSVDDFNCICKKWSASVANAFYPSKTSGLVTPIGEVADMGALNVVGAEKLTPGLFFKGIKTTGTITASGPLQSGLSIEDGEGVRVTVTKSGGGSFNIAARKGATGSYTDLGYLEGVSSVTYTVPKGVPIEVAAWSEGCVTYTRLVDTSEGGVALAMEMTPNPSINTALDVTSHLSSIALSLDISGASPVFVITFNEAMTVSGIELGKAIIHRLVGSEVALRAGFPPGSTSTIVINSDEITNQLPAVRLDVGASVPVTGRVYLDFFINQAGALAINPAYVINPVRADGNQVQILRSKPALDAEYLAAKVVAALPPSAGGTGITLAQIEASTVLAKEATLATKASQLSVNALATPPTPAQNAAAVRTELTTELGRMDAAISTRLASTGYTAPANADIAAIRAKTDVLVNADLSAVAKKTDLPTAPDNASIAAIKAKTDTLVNADLSALATHSDAVALSLQMGAPAQANALAALATANQAEHDATQAAIAAFPAPAAPPTPAQNAAAVRTELTTELARIDAAVSTRSTLQATDIPAGITPAQVWEHATRTLTETPGLTAGQAEQLRKVAQLHGVGAQLVVTETTRTAGDVQQTITTDADGNTTVSAA